MASPKYPDTVVSLSGKITGRSVLALVIEALHTRNCSRWEIHKFISDATSMGYDDTDFILDVAKEWITINE